MQIDQSVYRPSGFGRDCDLVPKVSVPVGECGPWSIERFSISEEEARRFNLRAAMACITMGIDDRSVKPGEYTRLTHLGDVVMSDTRAERLDHAGFVRIAKGRVLVTGLGLGMVIQALLEKPDVEHVTVIEISSEVINLSGPHYEAKYGTSRLEIINADAFTYKPGKVTFDFAWHDIWPDIRSDYVEQMAKMERKWWSRCGYQACWCEINMRRAKRGGF